MNTHQTNQEKAFCIVCGPLEVVNGHIVHPANDGIVYKVLTSGFGTLYTCKFLSFGLTDVDVTEEDL